MKKKKSSLLLMAGALMITAVGVHGTEEKKDSGTELYTITKVEESFDWEEIPVLSVDKVLWEPDYGIRANAQFGYDDDTLYVHLRAEEEDIRAEYTEPLSPVYKDSCLEFFFMPENGDRYFNFEINPNGCLYIGFGYNKMDNVSLYRADMEEMFQIKPNRLDDGWEVYYSIPLEFIRVFYPDYEFTGALKANVYKCGNETLHKHFLAWNSVGTEKPDFHQPDYFGKMIFQ